MGEVPQSRALGPRDAPAHTQPGREPKYPGNVTGEANPGREPGAGGVRGADLNVTLPTVRVASERKMASSSSERLDNSGGFMSEDTDDGDFDPNNPSQSTPGVDDGNMGLYGPALERERGRNASPTRSAGDGAPLERIVSRDFPHNDYYMVADGLNRNPNWTVYPAQLANVLKACAELAEDEDEDEKRYARPLPSTLRFERGCPRLIHPNASSRPCPPIGPVAHLPIPTLALTPQRTHPEAVPRPRPELVRAVPHVRRPSPMAAGHSREHPHRVDAPRATRRRQAAPGALLLRPRRARAVGGERGGHVPPPRRPRVGAR